MAPVTRTYNRAKTSLTKVIKKRKSKEPKPDIFDQIKNGTLYNQVNITNNFKSYNSSGSLFQSKSHCDCDLKSISLIKLDQSNHQKSPPKKRTRKKQKNPVKEKLLSNLKVNANEEPKKTLNNTSFLNYSKIFAEDFPKEALCSSTPLIAIPNTSRTTSRFHGFSHEEDLFKVSDLHYTPEKKAIDCTPVIPSEFVNSRRKLRKRLEKSQSNLCTNVSTNASDIINISSLISENNTCNIIPEIVVNEVEPEGSENQENPVVNSLCDYKTDDSPLAGEEVEESPPTNTEIIEILSENDEIVHKSPSVDNFVTVRKRSSNLEQNCEINLSKEMIILLERQKIVNTNTESKGSENQENPVDNSLCDSKTDDSPLKGEEVDESPSTTTEIIEIPSENDEIVHKSPSVGNFVTVRKRSSNLEQNYENNLGKEVIILLEQQQIVNTNTESKKSLEITNKIEVKQPIVLLKKLNDSKLNLDSPDLFEDDQILHETSKKCAEESLDIIESSIVDENFFKHPLPFKRIQLKPGKSWRRSLNEYKFNERQSARRSTSLFRIAPPRDIEKNLNNSSCYVCEEPAAFIEKQLEGTFRGLSLNRSAVFLDAPLNTVTAKEIVLRRCRQTEPLPFEECYPSSALKNCQKIGEGVFGEVFLYRNANGDTTVMKVVPIEGEQLINGEKQKKYEEILSEILISMELSNLRFTSDNKTSNFTEVKNVKCVVGAYPKRLLDLWDLYDETRNSENDSPAVFVRDQVYIVLELANGGVDLEAFVFKNALQAFSMFQQVACALAVAENQLNFEHRDLHWGNVLLSNTNAKSVEFSLENVVINVDTHGIFATIIDFTLSRMEFEGVVIYNDLASDPDLFNAQGDYQFEIYRQMKEKNGDDWEHFEPASNVLWLHYILDKAIIGLRYKNKKSKVHNKYLEKLIDFKENILSCYSAKEFILTYFD